MSEKKLAVIDVSMMGLAKSTIPEELCVVREVKKPDEMTYKLFSECRVFVEVKK